jgi:murein tripeptide amidase MpaA
MKGHMSAVDDNAFTKYLDMVQGQLPSHRFSFTKDTIPTAAAQAVRLAEALEQQFLLAQLLGAEGHNINGRGYYELTKANAAKAYEEAGLVTGIQEGVLTFERYVEKPVQKALEKVVLHKNLTGSAYSLGFLQFEYWLSATLRNR